MPAKSEHKGETPQQAIERIVGAVLDEVFQNQKLPLEVQRRAKEFAARFDYAEAAYLGPEAKRAAGGEYDAWTDEIFRSILAGEWRKEMGSGLALTLLRFPLG